MPEFIYDKHVYYNPVEFALRFVGGLWKMPILWRLNQRTHRYTELKKSLRHISDKVLSKELKELEANEMILRIVLPEVPPKTEYSITARGLQAIPVIESIRSYGLDRMKELGLSDSVGPNGGA